MGVLKGVVPEKVERKYTGMFAVGAKGQMPDTGAKEIDIEAMFGDMPEGFGAPPAGGPPMPGGAPMPPGGGPGAMMRGKGKPSAASIVVKEGVVAPAAAGFTPDKAEGVVIDVRNDGYLGGICVEGCDYTVENSKISLEGDGIALGGPGSGVFADNNSTVVIRDSYIETTGSARCATAAEHDSVLKVYNSTLISHGAPFGSELPPGAFMATPPAALEIDGNCRTHVTMSGSESYFYNSTISADGWAALSTDVSDGWVYLEANDCVVETVNSGYGAYADGGCHDVLNRCKVNVASMALIAAGECTCVLRDCDCDCGTYFLLSHCIGMSEEVTEVDVNGGTVHTKAPFALLKSCNARLDLDHVKIDTDCGALVRTVINDDPKAKNAVNPTGPVYGVRVSMKDMDVTGDLLHEDHKTRQLYLTLKNTILRGKLDQVCLAMTEGSFWTATADSTVMVDGEIDLTAIDAAEGITVTVTNIDTEGEYVLASGGKVVLKC